MKKLIFHCEHLLILFALLLAWCIPQAGPSTTASAKTPESTITIRYLKPEPMPNVDLLSAVYLYAQPTDWSPNAVPIEQIPTVQRAALALYRGPTNAHPHELEVVDFIEPDFETMPDRFLYPLTELPADQRYYLAYTADWQPTPAPSTNATQVAYSTRVEPGEIGNFHVTTNQQNVAFYEEELRFVTDYDAIELYPTTDAELLNSASNDQMIWFAFATQADASTNDAPSDYCIEESDTDFHITSLSSQKTWDLYATDLTDYLYPEAPTASAQLTHLSGGTTPVPDDYIVIYKSLTNSGALRRPFFSWTLIPSMYFLQQFCHDHR